MISFFFQAEDGIRDLVRSRGLGDVYKRQDDGFHWLHRKASTIFKRLALSAGIRLANTVVIIARTKAVSYTHLTLPTSDLV
mgnify:CR=1 FL=1